MTKKKPKRTSASEVEKPKCACDPSTLKDLHSVCVAKGNEGKKMMWCVKHQETRVV